MHATDAAMHCIHNQLGSISKGISWVGFGSEGRKTEIPGASRMSPGIDGSNLGRHHFYHFFLLPLIQIDYSSLNIYLEIRISIAYFVKDHRAIC